MANPRRSKQFVKNVEDQRKWPKFMRKYPQKNNNKEYLLYHELAGNLIYCCECTIA